MASVRWIISTAPEIFPLLAVAIGTILGYVKVRGFAVGTTACTLIVAVLTAQLGPFTFPPVLRGILFSLFAFTIGYRSGPEFFASFERTRHLWRACRRHDGRRAVTGCCEIAESQTPVLASPCLTLSATSSRPCSARSSWPAPLLAEEIRLVRKLRERSHV